MSEGVAEAPRKRQRVTQACHRCRRKKYKCNSVRPTCSTCSASNSECTYGSVAKRRGLQAGYVRAIEILWGLVFRKVDGSQHVVKELLADLTVVLSSVSSEGSGIDCTDDFLECWKGSGVPAAIESLLDGGASQSPRLEGGVLENVDNHVDLTTTSMQSWSLPRPDQFSSPPPSAPSPMPAPRSAPPTAAPPMSDTTCLDDNVVTTAQELGGYVNFALEPLPPDWHALTQVYLTVEHSWFPILERHAVFRIAYTYQDYCDTGTIPNDQHRSEFASLWIVLALSEIHSSGVSSSRVTLFKSVSGQFLSRNPTHDQYLNQAQALLLWSVLHLGCNELVLARLMLAQAIVLAYPTGLYATVGDLRSDQQRDVTFSGCFVLDALLSLAMGIRPQIMADDLVLCTPCEEAGSDEWEPYVDQFGPERTTGVSAKTTLAAPTRISSTFNHLVKLACILNTALRRKVPEAVLAADMQAWESNLPPHLKIDGTTTRGSTKNALPPQLHLRAWCLVISTVMMPDRIHEHLHVGDADRRQGSGEAISTNLHQIVQTFGVKALPASVSILILSLSTQAALSSVPLANEPTISDLRNTLTGYTALWGWSNPMSYHDDVTAIGSMSQSHIQQPPRYAYPDSAHDVYRAPYRAPITTNERSLGTSEQDGRILVPDLTTNRHLDATGEDLDEVVRLSTFDDTRLSGTGALHPGTPEQLRDYLALLQDNERYVKMMANQSSVHSIPLTRSALETIKTSCSHLGSSKTSIVLMFDLFSALFQH